MLLQDFSQSGRFHNANFTGQTSTKGTFAYRGDLILVGDFDVPPNERRPPSVLLTQAVLVSSEDQLVGVFGALNHLEQVSALFSEYRGKFSDDVCIMLFVRDVPKALTLKRDGVTVFLQPNDDTLIWNELLDVLYIEKGDLKKLSPEDRVLEVFENAKSYKSKSEPLDWDAALSARVEKPPVERVGAI